MGLATVTPTYRLLDEPTPGPLARFTVHPLWPMLAFMLGGAWLGFAWLAFNAFAVGSATTRRELVTMALGLGLVFAVVLGLGYLHGAKLVPPWSLPYLVIAVTVIKLACMYAVFVMQERSFALYEHFGGRVRNGAPVLVLAFLFGNAVSIKLDSPLFYLVFR